MFLLSVLKHALRAEHLPALDAVELDLLLRMRRAHHYLRLRVRFTCSRSLRCARGGLEGQAGKYLVIDGEVLRADLMLAFVVGALDHAVLGQFAHAVKTEGVAARQ